MHDDIGPYFQAKIRELTNHPLVGEVRGVGLLGAIELVKDKANRIFFPREMDVGTQCRNHCFANGLVMRAIRDTMVLAPPFIVSKSEVDEIVNLAWRCFDLTARDLGKSTG